MRRRPFDPPAGFWFNGKQYQPRADLERARNANAVWDNFNIGGTGSLQPNGPTGSFTLVFDEEFTGTSLNLTKWSSEWHQNGGVQNNVTTTAANVSVSGGYLTLTLSDASTGASINTDPADLNDNASKVGFQFTTGVVEARCNFAGNGTLLYNWPAWWTTNNNWPTGGENDIAEVEAGCLRPCHIDADQNSVWGTPAGYFGGWHTYTLQRFSDHFQVWYDGVSLGTMTTYEDVATSPQYLLLNIGNWSGMSGPVQTGSAGALMVDYVRAWV
jgi:beta-glucanase (GH16 family)